MVSKVFISLVQCACTYTHTLQSLKLLYTNLFGGRKYTYIYIYLNTEPYTFSVQILWVIASVGRVWFIITLQNESNKYNINNKYIDVFLNNQVCFPSLLLFHARLQHSSLQDDVWSSMPLMTPTKNEVTSTPLVVQQNFSPLWEYFTVRSLPALINLPHRGRSSV